MKRRTIGKIILATGLLLTGAGILGLAAGVYVSFAALRFNESAGIGAVGGGIWFAMLGSVTSLIGIALAIVGLMLVIKNKSGN